MPAPISDATWYGSRAFHPNGMVKSEITVALAENQMTMVDVRSVWTSLRTSSIAIADMVAPPKAARTPIACPASAGAPDENNVSFGHETTTTPNRPTMTADQR